jgi:hypothetical protein
MDTAGPLAAKYSAIHKASYILPEEKGVPRGRGAIEDVLKLPLSGT